MSDSYFDLPSRIEDAFAEIDSDIVMDLLNTDEDYAALSEHMDKLKTQYPVIDKMNEGSGEIRMTAEEHRAYVAYLNLARQMEDMERQHIYFRGHTDAVAYLKKSKRYKYDKSGAEKSSPLFCWQKCKASRKKYSEYKVFLEFRQKLLTKTAFLAILIARRRYHDR